MNTFKAILTFTVQAVLTFVVLCCIYMLLALFDSSFGLDGLVGLAFIQPVFAVLFSLLTLVVCGIAGLPVRLCGKIRRWWISRIYISLAGVACGWMLLVLSVMPAFMETKSADGGPLTEAVSQTPHPVLAVSGWLLTAFFLLHLFPPPGTLFNDER
ncbi:MAG: hypothetical protein LBJ01_06320 [Tannerella sp.]|jgi:hypothetical protein|nr:hypothetical protein [Tannerella sp.]